MENPDSGFVSSFDTPETVLAREKMVRVQIQERGIREQGLIDVLRKIPRHIFLPEEFRKFAYEDRAVPIGQDQTISQPFIVAYLASELEVRQKDRILEIGTGCGYLTAVLDYLGAEIQSLEILPELFRHATDCLERWSPGFTKRNRIECEDVMEFLPSERRFQKIVSSACLPRSPSKEGILFRSLEDDGLAVLPIEERKNIQFLITLEKRKDGFRERRRLPVKFVPLLGRTDLL